MKLQRIAVQFTGLRPLMFDRYAGDNSTQLKPDDKMYLNEKKQLTIPAINLFSLLAAENTKSVCRQFFGKNGKTIGLGISSYCDINPFEIPIEDDKGPIVFTNFGGQIKLLRNVARLKNGIPNPKERPCLALPWKIRFTVEYNDNKYCTLENLRSALALGGTLGLGTFRPFFGKYEMTGWRELTDEVLT
jgi:hypothetical protein